VLGRRIVFLCHSLLKRLHVSFGISWLTLPLHGKPYKRTTADCITLNSSICFIAQFRDAVKGKNPNTLSSVDSSQLLVYKNKNAFDKRKSNINKEEPLEEDCLIEYMFGISKKEALIVAVPSPLFTTYCEEAFFSNLSEATTDNYRLFIRESYTALASDIRSGINKVILTGTPGIGKSFFLFYLLHKLIREGMRVLFIYHSFIIYYDGSGNVFELEDIPSHTNHDFWSGTLWCLFDAYLKTIEDLKKCSISSCIFVISTSPCRDLVNDFWKTPPMQQFYMPIWSEKELEMIQSDFRSITEIDW